jgi:hypothetical protein
MNKKLGDEDRRALDLFLNRENPNNSAGVFVAPGTVTPKRVESVEKILTVLQNMPASDPPRDLVSRTLQRVDQAIAALQGPAAMPPQMEAGEQSSPAF